MRPSRVLPLFTVLVLSACNSGETVTAKNESAESVARKVAASTIKPLPGQWASTMKIEKMELPNMPPEAKAMMEKQLASAQTFTSCLKPEQVEKPDAEFFQGKSSFCTYDTFTMGGGKIDAVMTCGKGSQSRKMTMTGTYGPEAYAMRMSSAGEMQPGMPMSMTMSISAKRIGECTGKEDI